ncbi:MAG TPA: hypothetical protein VFJ16_25980 [Longimicrobium sp.]|nr:hypothetical protein [Longimicrobium sp.]
MRLVDNRGPAPGALGWKVNPAPLVSIGGADGDDGALFQVTAAMRLGDGRIVVASAGAQQLRIYGADGRLLRSVGRPGDGPGEFRAPFWLARLRADSIVAWDVALRRFSIFTPAGEFVRSVRPAGTLGVFPQAVGVLPDGRYVIAASASSQLLPAPGQARRDTAAYLVIDPAGAVVDTLGRFPGAEVIAVGTPATGFLLRPLPFGRQTVTAVHDGRLYVGTGDRYEIAAYEPGRGLRAVYRARRQGLAVTREDAREYRRTLVTLGGTAQTRAQNAKLLEEAPVPARTPPLTALEIDSAGNLWVEEPQKPGNARESVWTVLAPDGQIRGTVRLPPGLNVKQIGNDWVLGVVVDEDEVEHVRVHRLTR